ncbi:MAG TPA: cysteine synthase family protein [Ktedonobacterales bacterium]|nr:cysteine synthase family protein [Ktedonobacterales bacterium]
MALYPNLIEAIGHTPLVELARLSPTPDVRLYVKLEGANPTGSVKDRIARQMILEAERDGKLTLGSVILEPTSGNTGIGLAMIARVRGYRFVAVMPDNVTPERRQMLALYGAEIVSSPGAEGSNGAVRLAQRMAEENPGYVLLYQYGNPANPRAHYETTAPEILADLPDVDVFVAGLGTGGTLTGCGRRLKEHNPNIRVVAAEPLQGEGVQGLRSLADGFIPPVLDSSVLDAKILVHAEDSIRTMRALLDQEGIFTGPSGGAAVHAALRVANTIEHGKIVVLLADGGWKYLSEDLWTRELSNLDDLEVKLLW